MAEPELERIAERRLGVVLKEKYRLERVLGVGGMAAVYVATHRNQKQFALKMLHPELSIREDTRNRFLREGYAANSVKHAGVVAVMDDDIAEDGAAFLVMELLDGLSVEELWERHQHRLGLQVTLAIAYQMLDVLVAAHAAGIVHRDLKPANVFVTYEGQLKVLDFGIARVRDAAASGAGTTGAGTLLGTPAFMPPEQAMGKSQEIEPRSDLWAVGATIFTLLSGEFVHDGETSTEVLVKAASKPARPAASAIADLPPAVAEIIDRALAFDKNSRWQSATAMRDAIGGVYGLPDRAILAKAIADSPGAKIRGSIDPLGATAAGTGIGAGPSGAAARSVPEPLPPPSVRLEPAGLPTTKPLNVVLVVGAVLAVVGVALYGGHVVMARRALAQAEADVSRCLIRDPLATGEMASARVHRIRLAAISTSPPPGEIPWPRRCADRTVELAQLLEADGRFEDLLVAATGLSRVLAAYESVTNGVDISDPIDAFFEARADAKVELPPSSVTPPPAPVTATNVDTLPPKSVFKKAFALQTVAAPPGVDTSLSFVVNGREPLVCNFVKKDLSLHCHLLKAPGARAKGGLHYWGTRGSANMASFAFAGPRGKEGIYRLDTGAAVLEGAAIDTAFGASTSAPGILDYLELRSKAPELVLNHVGADDKVATVTALDKEDVGVAQASTALWWSWFLYRSTDNDEAHLHARALENGVLGPAEDIGRIPDIGKIDRADESLLGGCRSDNTVAIRVRGKTKQAVALHIGNKWTNPLEADIAPASELACDNGLATLTAKRDRDLGIVQTRCTATGCTNEDAPLKTLQELNRIPAEGHFAFASVKSKLAIVWYAGAAGGLRLRVAAPKDLDHADDRILFDDHLKGGKFSSDSTFRSFRILPLSSGLVLLIETTAGVTALWIDESGAPAPITVDSP